MVECEICGKTEAKARAKIENVVVNVCDECVSFGKEMPLIRIRGKQEKQVRFEEMEKELVNNFKDVVRRERAKKNLTQEELSSKIKERTSVIKRIENGWEPPINVVKKLEKFFLVKLMQDIEEGRTDKKVDKKKITIGDVVEVS